MSEVTLHINYSRFFFFNDTATTEIYTLSLHDALPISRSVTSVVPPAARSCTSRTTSLNLRLRSGPRVIGTMQDRKSTRLNSSHDQISYAVFCLKKKKQKTDYVRFRRACDIMRTHPSAQ